jgi:hypothetical protein
MPHSSYVGGLKVCGRGRLLRQRGQSLRQQPGSSSSSSNSESSGVSAAVAVAAATQQHMPQACSMLEQQLHTRRSTATGPAGCKASSLAACIPSMLQKKLTHSSQARMPDASATCRLACMATHCTYQTCMPCIASQHTVAAVQGLSILHTHHPM